MNLILEPGEVLFHGTPEEFPEDEISPGGYDDVIWTAQSSAVAQTYIPKSGGSSLFHAGTLAKPTKDLVSIKLQRMIGINYDLNQVKWDYMDNAVSFLLPPGWDSIPSDEEIQKRLISIGVEPYKYPGSFRVRTTYRDGDQIVHLRGSTLAGRLFIFTVVEPLVIYDNTLGGDREGDLMNVEYHSIPLFRRKEKDGYDGIKINDFAQTEKWGNVGHTSIGLFPRALEKLRWTTILAHNFEWDEDLYVEHTPEYLEYLNG